MVILELTLIFLATFLPSAIWLVFFLREDIHPEPKRLIVYAFALGGLASIPVLVLQIIFQSFALTVGLGPLILILGLAAIEECFKFFAAYLAVGHDAALDEPVDAMIYMIVAGLGFALVENLFIIGNNLKSVNSMVLGFALGTLSLRFVGATLLHALSSSVVGFYWAKGFGRSQRLAPLILRGLFFATLIHSFFNFLVIQTEDIGLIYPSLFLVVAAFFVLNDFEKLKAGEADGAGGTPVV
jgi:RsiW-degrading membrane proteinase PrsW (M82 family)